MSIDASIKNTIVIAIEHDLKAPKVPKNRVPKLKRVWKCESAYDFLYGQRVGYYTGLAEGIILERYRRQLTVREQEALFFVIAPYTKHLRKYFAFYKPEKE